MQMKLIILLLILTVFTGCSRDFDFNPTTTMLKHMLKGKK